MPTITTRLFNVTPADNAPILNIPTPEESALLQSASLSSWWRPDSNYNIEDKWIDKKNANALIRGDSGAWPDVLNGLNGQPYMYRQTGVGKFVALKPDAGSDAKFPAPPDRGYTFVWVGKPTLFDRPAVCAIFASQADTATNIGYMGYDSTCRRIWLRNRSSAYINYGLPNPEDEHIIIASFDYETQSAVLFVDGEQVATGTSASVPFSDDLSIFTPITPSGATLGSSSFAGHIYDLLIFDDALHQARNADQLAVLNSYMTTRYGL